MTLVLVLKGSGFIKEYTFTKEVIVVGRSLTNDLVIEDNTISRHHFKIYRQNDNFFIEDLNSTNGTYLNGTRVKNSVLKNGDSISISYYTIDVKIINILMPSACLLVLKNPYDERKIFVINKLSTLIGSTKAHIPARSKPFFPISDFSAAIVFRNSIYTLIPLNTSVVLYNSSSLYTDKNLKDGDTIEVGISVFQFKLQN
jgi:predicted component of type VI protein secretion system